MLFFYYIKLNMVNTHTVYKICLQQCPRTGANERIKKIMRD